ncbi:hypothetical protein M3Y94_00003500 [Aphelenchoides besseyi]|nr:hypothetical protein M3Y94_00003500 [Aphelenchoides besseyi]
MGNVESRRALLRIRKENEQADFRLIVENQSISINKKVLVQESDFFARLLADNPTLEEYSLKGKFEVVEWLIDYFYWSPTETFNNDELADNFFKYHDDIYSLAVRYSIDQLHEPFIETNMTELTLENAKERMELAAINEDHLLVKLLTGYINRNSEESKQLEQELAKLGII